MIFITGGAFTEVTRAFLDQHPERALGKPLDMKVLRERLRALLESQNPPPTLAPTG